MASQAIWNTNSDESFHSDVLSEIDFMYSTKESVNKYAKCIFYKENSPRMDKEKFGFSISARIYRSRERSVYL